MVLSLVVVGISSVGLAGDGKWGYKGEKLEEALAAKGMTLEEYKALVEEEFAAKLKQKG